MIFYIQYFTFNQNLIQKNMIFYILYFLAKSNSEKYDLLYMYSTLLLSKIWFFLDKDQDDFAHKNTKEPAQY